MSNDSQNHSDNHEDIKSKTIVGLTEKVVIKGNNSKSKELIARVDSGATKSSIDITLASELELGPVIDSKLIRSAHGTKLRPVVEVNVVIKGKRFQARFTIADRNHMRYPVLIGQNILKQGFLIDPTRRADKPMPLKK
ncbi:ATP-dependent zinc protease [Candidatus Woesearchaeota archaeon]|nr:ATP-dependent zinc protease [Candidatus Woesearchaeota archaeon]